MKKAIIASVGCVATAVAGLVIYLLRKNYSISKEGVRK